MAIRFTAALFAVIIFFPLTVLNAQEQITSGYFIDIENGEKHFFQRLTWHGGGEYVLRYEVIIQKLQDGAYINLIREFTADAFIIVSLQAGFYRFQVIPYDLLDNQGTASQWSYIEVLAAVQPGISAVVPEFTPTLKEDRRGYSFNIAGNNFSENSSLTVVFPDGTSIEPELLEVSGENINIFIEQEKVIPGMYEFIIRNPGGLEESVSMMIQPIQQPEVVTETQQETAQPTTVQQPEATTEAQQAEAQQTAAKSKKFVFEGNPAYNTIGVSLGTSFVDPRIIASVNGTYAPFSKLPNLFFQLGVDFGFISRYSDVEEYYSIYPFLNAGYYLPIRENIGLFAGAGAGYMTGKYTFSYGYYNISDFGVNFFAGFNLFNIINITYGIRTDFGSLGHRLTAGYMYRFIRREKNAEE